MPLDDDITAGDSGHIAAHEEIATTLNALAATYQPLDSDLTAIAALSTTSFGRSLLEAANASALRTLAGTAIGTDVQAYDADLSTLAAGGSGATTLLASLLNGTYEGVAWHHFVPCTVEPVAVGGTWAVSGGFAFGTAYWFNQARNQSASPANGNFIAWDVPMAAGTWRLDSYFMTDPDACKVQQSLDGTDVGALTDLHLAGAASRLAVQTTGIVVASAGLKRIKFTANGKNASSANYYLPISAFSLTRTA